RAENPEELPRRKENVEAERTGKMEALQAVQDTLAGLRTRKHEMERAGDAAADFRQQAESVAAEIREDASRFIRLRLAAHSLRSQIERYREENQGPLLAKSGEVFSHITRGAFD